MVQDLPLNGRDFVNLAYLAPGAKPVDSYDPTKQRVGVFAVNGGAGRNVNVTVNGIDNKDNTVGGPVMQMPLESIQEFNISTQRFSAANGRSEGAAINVITRSGSNTPHGSLFFFGRNEALNTQNALESEKSPYSRQQFGGSVGAPIECVPPPPPLEPVRIAVAALPAPRGPRRSGSSRHARGWSSLRRPRIPAGRAPPRGARRLPRPGRSASRCAPTTWR